MVGFVAGVIVSLLFVFPILALIAFVKTRQIPLLYRKLEALEFEVAGLRASLRAAPSSATTTAVPSPTPASVQPASIPPAGVPRVAPPSHGPAGGPARRPPHAPRPPFEHAEVPPGPVPPAASGIDWERWIGIRGAAVLGGVVLALAALLFFQYSIQRGLITPQMRVVLGIAAGVVCIVGSEWLRARGYRVTAEGVSGGGIVCLYAAFWAAHTLYGLVGTAVTFFLMGLVTVACCTLSIRHNSQIVATLGLLGGFATPLLLRSGSDRPIGLFGYVLLLDLGLLAIGRKKDWPLLGILSLAGTVLLQGLWIHARMGPERAFLGLGILALFALLFAIAPQWRASGGKSAWLVSQAGAVLFTICFASYFAGRVDLGPRLWPIALLLAILGAAAGWVGRVNDAAWLATGAALGSVAVVAIWASQRTATATVAWDLVLCAILLTLVFHVFVELAPERGGVDGPAPAALIAACGLFVVTAAAAGPADGVSPWPWLAGWLAIGAVLYRHAAFEKRAALQVVAATLLALAATSLHALHAREDSFPALAVFFGVLVAIAVVAQVVAVTRRDRATRLFAEHAAATFPVLLVLLLVTPYMRTVSIGIVLTTILVLTVLALLSATRLPSGPWYAAIVFATMFSHGNLVLGGRQPLSASAVTVALAFLSATVVLVTLWPFLVGRTLVAERFAVYAAALAGALWFWPLKRLFVWRLGDSFIGILPLALGALSVAALAAARRQAAGRAREALRAVVWLAAAAISFATLAIPLQLEKEWITIGWALEGLALVALWLRLDHPGLKYFALFAFGAATVRLVLNPALLTYYPRAGMPIVNWILYTYLVPAAALLAGARLLRPFEAARARPFERALYEGGRACGAILLGIAAIAVIFVWINLAIADWFTEGPVLTLRFGRLPARDLTVSIAWAIYAIALLLIGMFRNSVGLRWLSLAFLVVTIGKVFLYDLGELRDLYRVASLVGLAVSLILVSLLYQRFVFRTSGRAGQDGGA